MYNHAGENQKNINTGIKDFFIIDKFFKI